jgi:hypothetical protein
MPEGMQAALISQLHMLLTMSERVGNHCASPALGASP